MSDELVGAALCNISRRVCLEPAGRPLRLDSAVNAKAEAHEALWGKLTCEEISREDQDKNNQLWHCYALQPPRHSNMLGPNALDARGLAKQDRLTYKAKE